MAESKVGDKAVRRRSAAGPLVHFRQSLSEISFEDGAFGRLGMVITGAARSAWLMPCEGPQSRQCVDLTDCTRRKIKFMLGMTMMVDCGRRSDAETWPKQQVVGQQ
jgi:hypothetical protein